MAEGEHLKMILVDNKSPHAVTLYILQNWSKSPFLSLSFIVNGGESFLFHRKTTFRFELTAPPEKKNITIWGPIMWEKDILLRVSGDDDIQVKDEEFPKEKQICLRRNYMKEEVSASGMKNLYEILGLNMKEVRKKSIEEQNEIIKKAYYSQLRRWHPDRNPGNGDKAICQKIINAYDILKDPEARAAYNNVADYDKGWCSQARWGEVFKPECYSDEQKKQYRKRMGLLILSSVLVTAGIGLTFVTAGMSGPVVLGIIAGATFRCGISSRSRELIDKAKAFKKYFISLMIGADGGAAMGAGVAEITKLLDGEAKLALKDAKLSLERQIAITMTRNVFRGFTNSVANNLDAVLADGQKITWEEFLLHVLTDALLGGIAGLRGGLTENMIEKLVSAKDVAAAFERVISSSTHNRFEVVTKIAVETFANLIEHLDDDVENNSVEDDIKNSARLAAIAVENHFTMMDNEVPKIIEDGEDITGMEAKSNEAFHDISEETCDETKNYANSTKSAARNAKETVGKDGITTTSDNEESTRDSNDVSDKFQKSNREIKQDDCGENAKGNSDKSDKTLQVYMPMPVETNVKRDFTKRTPPYEKEETNYNECTQLAGQRMTYISEGAWFSKMLVDYEEDGEEKHHEGYGSGSSILIPNNATNIKVKFQVMRTPGVWCDVKKYDHFKKCWVKPTKPHIFKYDKPVSCTYTLDGNLYFEKVTKITGEYFREMFDCGLPRYKTLVDETTNSDDFTGPVKHQLKYISEGLWLSKMLVDFQENGETKHYEIEDSESSFLLPTNATNIKVRFQVMRAPGIWCDVKKYDRFKKCWVKPIHPHIFEYDKPLSRTFTLADCEAVMKITGGDDDNTFDIDGRAQSREEFGSYDGTVKLVDNKDHISADVKVDHVIEDSQLAMLSSTLNSGIKESTPIVSDEDETHSVDSGFEERNNAFYKWFDMGAFHENGEMKKEYKEKMARFKWVQSFSIVDAYEEGNDYNLEIVCKYGEVPCNEDIVELLGEDILPCITYKKASKIGWFETNILDKNFEIKREYANGLLR
ncbi:uncharacterized protein LOC114540234 [Dendronephthya gigantea]|uniref:uncharacterized protein LOC114540234 n=1 Tax=Dendronephthya gigantea TaxID=151771 RepID=UPI00106A24C4|nr:uncharacterized protein LOC114540234 [Dendronephthya gigantea]